MSFKALFQHRFLFLCFGIVAFVTIAYAIDQASPLREQVQATLPTRLKEHIKYDPNGPNTIGHIYIGGKENEINQSTFLYVNSALDHFKKTKPAFVILELNSPGGEVFAAERISDILKDLDTQNDIPVVTFINNWAMSAGAMLAYSTRFITVVKDGSMGAAEPITMEEGKMQAASEKINSALRADFANRARFFDRNPLIAEAMVDKDIILVLRHGQIVKLDNETQIRAGDVDPDLIISPKGKLLTLNAQELVDYGVADSMLLPMKLDSITPEENDAGKWPANKSLLMHQPFFKDIPQATIDSYRMDWKTQFFALLASPVVSSILFLGLILSVYMEMNTPGFGLAATVGVICLFLIILSSFALQAFNWLELIFLVTGIVIIVLELFVLPTFGLLGIIGVLLFFAGLFGLMIPGIGSVNFDFDTSTFNAAGEFFLQRLAWLCATLFAGIVIIGLLARYIAPKMSLFNRFVLTGSEQDASAGYTAVGEDGAKIPPRGSKGIVAATLRPAGKVIINDNLYDAISEGGFIEKGTPIIVVQVEGNKIIVNVEDVESL